MFHLSETILFTFFLRLVKTKISKRKKVTEKELYAVEQNIIDLQNEVGIIYRILGAFTLVNII